MSGTYAKIIPLNKNIQEGIIESESAFNLPF